MENQKSYDPIHFICKTNPNISHFNYYNWFFACKNNPASPNPTEQATFDDPRSGAALAASFDGNKLVEWPDLDSIKNRRTYNIEMNRAVYLGHLNDVKGYLLYGRAFMENGQVENAADIFQKES